jgi:hypothetical protein
MSVEMLTVWAGKIQLGSKEVNIQVIWEILTTGLCKIVFRDWIMIQISKKYQNFSIFKVYLYI